MRTRLIAVLVALAAVAVFTTEASAMYHAGMGVFMQRDPGAGAGGPARMGAGGAPAATGRFIPRDPTGSNQYADRMNLYQYVRGNPVIYVDPQGLACCAYVRLSNAFGIPGISSIGGGHTAVELDRDGKSTLIELAAYNDGGHAAANRVGHGPLGPTMYIYYALLAQSYGLTDRDDLTKMNDLSQKYFGHPATWGIDMLDLMGQGTVGAGPRHFYGLFVSPNMTGSGKKIQIKLPAGQECATLDKMIKAAKDIGQASKDAQMYINFKIRNKQMNVPILGNVVVNADVKVGLWVGLGYDFVSRNCNSFTGSVLRKAGVAVPNEVSSQWGIGNDFATWRRWDLAFQKQFQDAADRASQ